jgi:hypothetical protein
MGKSGGAAKQQVTEFRMSIHYGISWEFDGLTKITLGDKVAWEGDVTTPTAISINKPDLFGGVKKEGGAVGVAYFLPGRADQVMPALLAARLGLTSETCPAYRGIGSVFFVGSPQSNTLTGLPGALAGEILTTSGNLQGGFYWTANSPFLQPASFTGYCAPIGLDPDYAMIGPDANPAGVIYECLTDRDFGMGAPAWQFNTPMWEAIAAQLFNEGFGLSLGWNAQMEIEAFVSEILDHIQATFYVNPNTGLMELKLWRDDYDIGDLRTIHAGNSKLYSFQRKLWGQVANEIVVSWTNPVNEQEETVSAQMLGAIAAQGDVASDSRNYYGIRNALLAMDVAERDVRSSSAPLAAGESHLDRSFWNVLPGELLIANYPEKGVNNIVVRVLTAERGRKGDPAIKVSWMEDVFSLTRKSATIPPGTGWDGAAEEPAPMDAAAVFTLPAFIALQQIGPRAADLAYPEVVAGLLCHRDGQDTIAYNLYAEQAAANGEMWWTDLGVKSVLGRAFFATPLYQEAVSEVAGLPLIERNRGPRVGGFAFIGDGSDTGTEIALIDSLDDDTGVWTLKRGVLDTVPRPWPIDTPVWFVPPEAVIADTVDIRAAGEEPEYKMLTRTSLGQLPIDEAPLISGTMSARPHLPLRPANITINGIGFGEIDATGATDIEVTWANRNRLFEDGQAVAWDEADVAGEYLQETLISVYREDGSPFFQVRGLWTETDYTIPLAWVEEETRIFIRVSSERQGLGSLQSYGLWVDDLPAVALPSPPPDSPVIVGDAPDAPDPDPDPTPPPLGDPDPAPPPVPGGGGGGYEWQVASS